MHIGQGGTSRFTDSSRGPDAGARPDSEQQSVWCRGDATAAERMQQQPGPPKAPLNSIKQKRADRPLGRSSIAVKRTNVRRRRKSIGSWWSR